MTLTPAILFSLAGFCFFVAAFWTWTRGKENMAAPQRKLLVTVQLLAAFGLILAGAMHAGLIA